MIIDTDVLIWYLRGNEKALNFIEKTKGFYLSVVTYMELADSLIGSTAIVYGLPLVTCNEKHYKIIKELELIKFKSK